MDSFHRQAIRICLLGCAGAALQESDPTLDLPAIFRQSRNLGLTTSSLDQISREWAPRLGISEEDVLEYLTKNIHYTLDAECLDGLALFYRYAAELGALPGVPELKFAGTNKEKEVLL